MSKILFRGLASAFVSAGVLTGAGIQPAYGYQGARRNAGALGAYASAASVATVQGSGLGSGAGRGTIARGSAAPGQVAATGGDDVELSAVGGARELVIIDAAVPDKQSIYRNLRPGMAVRELRPDEDGLTQLRTILAGYQDLDVLHVFSHAQDGTLYLGDSAVTQVRLQQRLGTLAAMDRALKDGADVLFYGCELARGERGEALLELVAGQAHVDVAASNDVTGANGLGGDWDLEIRKGDIEAQPRFDSVAMADFSSVLAYTGTLNLNGMSTGYANKKSYTLGGTSYVFTVKSGGAGSKDLYNYSSGYVYISTGSSTQTSSSVYFAGGEQFDLSSIYVYQGFGAPTKTIRLISDKGGVADSTGTVPSMSGTTINVSGPQWTGITSFTIQYSDSTTMHWVKIDNVAIANLGPAQDSDGMLTAAATVTEPVALPTTVDTVGEAVDVFDFTLSDGGGGDGLPTTVSQIVVHASGTTSDTVRDQITWRLNGPDVSNVTGTYNAGADTITFSGLSISVADSGNETYTVNAYYNDNTSLTEDQTVVLSIDGDTDLTLGGSGTQMSGSNSAVTNGAGSTIDITATELRFTTQPAGSTSGSALSTQPVVTATDAFGNTDVDFASNITVTEASVGSLSGTTTIAATNGVATFTDVAYTATADQQGFSLTASASGLTADTSNAVTADVVATKLVFDTQPAPTTLDSGSSTSFATVPVVRAVDSNNLLDTGYGTNIVLSVTDPNDGTIDGTVDSLTGTGDADGDGTTVTLTPSSGTATFTNLALQYTNSGYSESIALRASSGGLTSANSSTLTSVVNNAPVVVNLNGDSVSWAGLGNTVRLDSGGDATAGDTELDALNGANGDYSGGSLTVQRAGGAVTSDIFGFDTSGALFTVNGGDLQDGGQTFATFTNSNGVLSISFTSSGTTATTALVSDVLQRITYRNDTPAGDATVRFTLSDGSKTDTADVTVTSDSVYITNTTDTATIDPTDGTSFSEAIAIAAADGTGTQTLILDSSLAAQTVSTMSATSLTESLTLSMDSASGVTLSGGMLTLGGGTTLTLTNGSSDTASIGTVFAGTGGLAKTGAGTVTLTGTQTYSGTTTFTGGTVSVAGDSNLGSGQLVMNGGTLVVTSAGTIDNSVNLAADSTISHANDLTLPGLLSGAANLSKAGAGQMNLTNSGNEAGSSGGITVTEGKFYISDDDFLPSGTITLNGGSFLASGASGQSDTVDNNFVVGAAGGTFHIFGGGGNYTLNISGVISGSGNLEKITTATLVLSGTNTYTGNFTISTGNVSITDGSNLGSGTVTLDGGTLTVTGSDVTINNNLVTSGGTFSNANNVTWSGVISGTGGLTKTGAGTLTLAGTQTHSGSTNITAGAVSITDDSNLGAGTLTLNGGTLTVTGSSVTIDNAISLGASHGTVSNANAVTLSGVLSGSGNLTKSGAGTLTLSGTNTYTGSTALSAGQLTVSGSLAGAVAAAAGTTLESSGSIDGLVIIGTGATLQTGAAPGSLTLGSGLILNSGGVLVARINGTSAGVSYDQYNVTGAVTLGGNLSVIGSYSPAAGDSFEIIANDGADGVGSTFSGVPEGDKSTTLNGKPLTVSYLGASGNDVVLSAVAPVVTDGNVSISGATGTGGAYKIGDTVTVTWDDTAATGDNNGDIAGVTVDFSAFGGGAAVAATNSSDTWTATYALVSGAVDGTNLNVAVTATDSDGLSRTTADTSNATVDNAAPSVSDGNISISGATGSGGAYKIGDTVTATWNNTAGGDNNSDVAGVTVDFSAFGGGAAVAASNSSGTWTATYTVVAGALDGSNRNVSVTVTDDAGNARTTADTSNATVDNGAPTVTDANISISGATGSGGTFVIGDTVTATWNDTAGGDNNTDTINGVSVDFSAFGGGAAVAASNSSGTWTATYTLVAGAVDSSNLNVAVTATDDAGNSTTTADTSNATVDNTAPTVTDANISISGASGTGGAYKIGDTVTATWNNTAGGDNNADTINGVSVDFSAFGGGAAVAASNSSGTWTATYTLVAGAVDSSNLNVTVTATDDAGNTTPTADTSNATVDTQAPVVSDAHISLSGASGSGGTFIEGDTVTASWDDTAAGDNNGDSSTVTVDFSAFGGGAAVAASNSSGTWSASYTLTSASSSGSNLNAAITVTDDAGNVTTTADTSNAAADAAAPAVDSVSASTADGSYRAGDTITLQVLFSEAVTVAGTPQLTLETGVTDRVVSYSSGSGTTTLTFNYTVQSGDSSADLDYVGTTALALNGGTITDSAGNAADLTLASPGAAGSLGANKALVIDTLASAPTLTTAAADPVNGAFTVSIAFGEPMSGFVVGDLSAGNASLSGFADNGGGSYSVTVTPTADGTVTLDLAADAAQDAAGNGNQAAAQLSLTYDGSAPQPVLSSAESDPSNSASFVLSIDFGEAVTGFAVGDISAGNASLGGFTDNGGGRFEVTVTPSADGAVTVDVSAGAAQDGAGNASLAATQFTLSHDASGPTLSSSTPADGATGVATDTDLVLVFSEAVSAGTGAGNSIVLYDADGQVASLAADSAVISGSTATLTLPEPLIPGRSYHLQIGNAAFLDAAGNAYAGIADSTSLNFTAANASPVATADAASVAEDESVKIAVLANDSDADSDLDAGSVEIASAPAHGRVIINTGTGAITYTPTAAYSGSDSFTYTVYDVHGAQSAAATVTVSVTAVNDAPVAVGEVVSTPAGNPLLIDVAANDSDIDSGDSVDAASVAFVTQPGNGSVELVGTQLTYTPNAGFSGSDSFSYTIEDQNGAVSNTATVIVNVTGANALPIAADDVANVVEDASVVVDVLANDSDSDGSLDTASVRILTGAAHGSTTVDATTGEVTYTPAANYSGSDSFAYVVGDDAGGSSDVATVTVTVAAVNDAPTAADDRARVDAAPSYRINVLANDSDVDGSLDASSVAVVSAPAKGAVSVDPVSGVITYTPNNSYDGSDSFTYRVRDDSGVWSAAATVNLTLAAINDAPLANDDSAATSEDAAVTIAVLANDSDVDGSLGAATVTIGVQPSAGTVAVNLDGSVTYTPDPDAYGSDSFSYAVADDALDFSNEATVTVVVAAVNDAPAFGGVPAANVVAGQAYSFTPTLSDADGDTLSVTASNLPAWASLDPATGVVTGAPSNADTGVYSGIVLSASDGVTSTALTAFSIEVLRDTDGDGTDDANDADVDGDGMPNTYETGQGFDPLDSADGIADSDGDGVSNAAEYVAATDPHVDDNPPVFGVLADLSIDATGLLTELPELVAPEATDARDGQIAATLVTTETLFAPGLHTLTWAAEDAAGNRVQATQRLLIHPRISLSKDQVQAEGANAVVKVLLNGQAPSYPFSVGYSVAGTASAADHNLSAGTVTFAAGQVERSIALNIVDDGSGDDGETIVVSLDAGTTTIGTANFGVKRSHVISVVERNVAPTVTLAFYQNARQTRSIAQDGGMVTIVATVTDPNPGDSHSFDWSFPSAAVITDVSDAMKTFDPADLAPGLHPVALTVYDDAAAPLSASDARTVLVLASAPVLDGSSDSDGDGTDDASEGTGDADGDGQPDYLDAVAESNVITQYAADGGRYQVEADPGVRIELGDRALRAGADGTGMDNDELAADAEDPVEEDSIPNVGGYVDFLIRDFERGASVQVVVPQRQAIPERPVYRKYADGRWFTFVETSGNSLASAAGAQGACPPPGSDDYAPGLTAGHWCVQLTISDGGPNDADGAVNGVVVDPGGVGRTSPPPAPPTEPEEPEAPVDGGSSGGGGSTGLPLLGLLMLAWGWRWRSRRDG